MTYTDFQGELERMHPASFGWALWCCDHRREEAEEILQTAYLRVMEGSARFDGNSSLRTWFFGVIRRTASEHRRRRWLRNQILRRWITREIAPQPEPNPEAAASGSQSSRVLRQAVSALPTRQREVLHLVFYQDLTVEEASRVLKISVGTARTHFARGKAQLRQILTEPEENMTGRRNDPDFAITICAITTFAPASRGCGARRKHRLPNLSSRRGPVLSAAARDRQAGSLS